MAGTSSPAGGALSRCEPHPSLLKALLMSSTALDACTQSDASPGMQEMPVSSAKAADSPLPTGRLLTYSDIVPQLKGRQAEVCHCPKLPDLSWWPSVCMQSHVLPLCLPACLTILLLLQLFWPDDKMWYLVEIHSIIPSKRTAKCAPALAEQTLMPSIDVLSCCMHCVVSAKRVLSASCFRS